VIDVLARWIGQIEPAGMLDAGVVVVTAGNDLGEFRRGSSHSLRPREPIDVVRLPSTA